MKCLGSADKISNKNLLYLESPYSGNESDRDYRQFINGDSV